VKEEEQNITVKFLLASCIAPMVTNDIPPLMVNASVFSGDSAITMTTANDRQPITS